jgi:hypothetical protein
MTKLYPLDHPFIKQNYPIIHRVFSEPIFSPSERVLEQTSLSGYEAFKLAGERLKTRQNLSTV